MKFYKAMVILLAILGIYFLFTGQIDYAALCTGTIALFEVRKYNQNYHNRGEE